MKSILKTLPDELQLDYDEKFTGESNAETLRQLIPHLSNSMKPRYNVTVTQLRNWLSALHKHCRVRILYKKRGKLDKDNRRLHKNNRLNEARNLYLIYLIC